MPFDGPSADKVEIRELIETYGDAVILRDAAQWASTWSHDATWILGNDTHTGKENIVSAWLAAMDRFAFAALQATPGLIVVRGDSAQDRVHVQESLVQRDGQLLRIWGRYDDELTKTSGRWLFKTRKYTVLHAI